MKYAYENLGTDQFENLIVILCQKLLGLSVQGFAAGPDGGRDAKFVGTAENHPSKTKPWQGTVIIQAKHTSGYNKAFSDSDFYSDTSQNTVLGKEIPRIKKLRDGKKLDHYMLFANRRMAGNAEEKLRGIISTQCGLPIESIYLCDINQIELWLKHFPEVAAIAEIDPIDSPLTVSPDELADVIHALSESLKDLDTVVDKPPTARISYEEKNKINNMTEAYAKALLKNYLKQTGTIKSFLSNPENLVHLKSYEQAVEEFQLKIIAKRKDYQTFDNIIVYLEDLLLNRDAILAKNKKLTRAMLFYMYWNCDIGLEEKYA